LALTVDLSSSTAALAAAGVAADITFGVVPFGALLLLLRLVGFPVGIVALAPWSDAKDRFVVVVVVDGMDMGVDTDKGWEGSVAAAAVAAPLFV